MCSLNYDTKGSIYRTETDSQTQKTNTVIRGERVRGVIKEERGINRYKPLCRK